MTSWTVVDQVPPSMGFPRQEYWGGSPFPSPGDLADPGIEPRSPALQADSLPSEPPGKPIHLFAQSKGREQPVLKRSELLNGFQGRVFLRQPCCSLWTLLWLVGNKVVGWCFHKVNHQPSGSNQTGVYVRSASSHHPPPGLRGSWFLQNHSKICVRLLYIALEEELGLFYQWTININMFKLLLLFLFNSSSFVSSFLDFLN